MEIQQQPQPQPPITQNLRNITPPPEILPTGAAGKFIYFSAFVFLLTVLVYIGISFGYVTFLNQSISGLKEDLDKLGAEISLAEQNDLVALYSQINNLKSALDNHVEGSNLFTVLEENTDVNVKYDNINISIPDSSATISGVASSYEALVSQLAIFDQAPEIKRMSLDNSNSNEGVIVFDITLTMDKEVFVPKL